MVVVPAMLATPRSAAELAHRLHMHYLANPEASAQFAVLSDWVDAPGEQLPADDALLAQAVQEIDALNQRYPAPGDAQPFPGAASATQLFCVRKRLPMR